MKGLREKKGITLIALIVTIVLLLILAGMSIAMVNGSGLFTKAKEGTMEYKAAAVEEKIKLFMYEWSMENIESEKTLADFLQEKSLDGQIEDYEETTEGIDIYLDGYVLTVDSSGEIIGDVQEAVARPYIIDGSLSVTLENGNAITQRQEVGTRLKVQFRVAVDGGAITSIEGLTGATVNTSTGEVSYTTTGSELELLFKVKGSVGGIESKANKKVSLTNYYVATIQAESLLKAIGDNEFTNDEVCKVLVNGELYKMRVYNYNSNLTISENTTLGRAEDIGTSSSYAKNMVVLKVNGNLTINQDIKLGPIYTEYGGPKGFMVYVTGTLTNNGIIDNSHGAYAEGQDVYLWKNTDESMETVSGVSNGTGRFTGNGGRGRYWDGSYCCIGGTGTSYSGGAGAGGYRAPSDVTSRPGNGSSVGGAGGNAIWGWRRHRRSW